MDIKSKIVHDEKNHEFSFETPDGKVTLNYLEEEGALNFHHTFVPPALRGKGLAEQIVRYGFEYADKKGQKVIPTCPYVSRLVMQHDELKPLVASK